MWVLHFSQLVTPLPRTLPRPTLTHHTLRPRILHLPAATPHTPHTTPPPPARTTAPHTRALPHYPPHAYRAFSLPLGDSLHNSLHDSEGLTSRRPRTATRTLRAAFPLALAKDKTIVAWFLFHTVCNSNAHSLRTNTRHCVPEQRQHFYLPAHRAPFPSVAASCASPIIRLLTVRTDTRRRWRAKQHKSYWTIACCNLVDIWTYARHLRDACAAWARGAVAGKLFYRMPWA